MIYVSGDGPIDIAVERGLAVWWTTRCIFWSSSWRNALIRSVVIFNMLGKFKPVSKLMDQSSEAEFSRATSHCNDAFQPFDMFSVGSFVPNVRLYVRLSI